MGQKNIGLISDAKYKRFVFYLSQLVTSKVTFLIDLQLIFSALVHLTCPMRPFVAVLVDMIAMFQQTG